MVEVICASEVLTQSELRNFHPALEKYLNENGLNIKILTGTTKAQGGNRTVSEMEIRKGNKSIQWIYVEKGGKYVLF